MRTSFLMRLVLLSVLASGVLGQAGFFAWNQRTHPELTWYTLETEHFNIHYHNGIESIALKAAQIAEQVYPVILEQIQVEPWGKTDVTLTTEDEVMNGFAMPSDQIFIWVSQNDVAGHFGGSEKWLRLVLAHEFQHVAQFHVQDTWAGIWSQIGVPGWWLEGMAEYNTEVWRVGRSDNALKINSYNNILHKLEAHNMGYAKVLYLAWKYGDSTLVKISHHRIYLDEEKQKYPIWYDFDKAFEKAVGKSANAFDEEWRRVMDTYYYTLKGQKEGVDEVGEGFKLTGFKNVNGVSIAPDSSAIAVLGRKSDKQYFQGVYVVSTDSNHTVERIHVGAFNNHPTWSPTGNQIVVSELHRGKHGSLINDLRIMDRDGKHKRWLTENMRALHPVFGPDSQSVYFVAHPVGETSNIYRVSTDNRCQVKKITWFSGDVQIRQPQFSPDYSQLAMAIQDTSGFTDIAVVNADGTGFRKLTNDYTEDLNPIWTSDGKGIVFTSYRNETPNLYHVAVDSAATLVQMTDVAEAVYPIQRIPGTDRILTSTLADVDTVRLVSVAAERSVEPLPFHIRDRWSAWRTKSPKPAIPEIDYTKPPEIVSQHPYRGLKTLRPITWFALPDDQGLTGLFVASDALGKHMLTGMTNIKWNGDLQWGSASYSNLNYWPILSVYGQYNLGYNQRVHTEGSIYEAVNGAGVMAAVPMNSGKSLFSNHLLSTALQLHTRKVLGFSKDIVQDSLVDGLREGSLVLDYRWKSQRPHKGMVWLPYTGTGFNARAELVSSKLWGDADYQKLWLDGFTNLQLGPTPFVAYVRAKWEKHTGSVPYQDRIGLLNTMPLYYSPGTLSGVLAGLLYPYETYNLRGQQENYYGREVLYQVTELRFPFIPAIPANVLGITLNHFTGALFSDVGMVKELLTPTPEGDPQKALQTFGLELKANAGVGDMAFVILSYGVGGDADFWSNKDFENDALLKDHTYFRLALVNPF
ncbi:MAG: hypothetical protein K9N34_08500 [Candidatus Marinimicrobia bacterium]|nr:hypothetical protein [Candidatus Neomarinimicrobiota bacterium]MCF7841085.1 hypothetical protein [Candidatus Neomarinimicrobiota bacterium]